MKIKRLILIFVVMGLLVYVSCRKLDSAQIQSENAVTEEQVYTKFFATSPNTLDVVKSIVANIKRQDEERHFVSRLTKKAGYPIWDKAIITTSRNISSRIESTTVGGNTGETIIIPIVLENGNTTNAALVVNTEPTDTAFQLIYGSAYSRFDFVPATNGGWNAKDIFHVFTKFDKELFGHNVFKILDKRLLTLPAGTDTSRNFLVKFRSPQANAIVANTLIPQTECDIYDICYEPDEGLYQALCGGVCTEGCTLWVGWEETCTTTWIETGGGSGGNGGGGSVGSGGNWDQTLCLDDINTPEDECATGWVPNPNPTPPAPEPIDSMLARFSRAVDKTADSIFQLSMNSAIKEEWGFPFVQKNNDVYPKRCTTIHRTEQVILDRYKDVGETIMGELHTHPDPSPNPLMRSAPSGDDLETLNVNSRLNYTIFIECGNVRYALVIENVTLARAYLASHPTDLLAADQSDLAQTIPNWGTNWQNATQVALVQLLGVSTSCGIGFYKSDSTKTNFTKLN